MLPSLNHFTSRPPAPYVVFHLQEVAEPISTCLRQIPPQAVCVGPLGMATTCVPVNFDSCMRTSWLEWLLCQKVLLFECLRFRGTYRFVVPIEECVTLVLEQKIIDCLAFLPCLPIAVSCWDADARSFMTATPPHPADPSARVLTYSIVVPNYNHAHYLDAWSYLSSTSRSGGQ